MGSAGQRGHGAGSTGVSATHTTPPPAVMSHLPTPLVLRTGAAAITAGIRSNPQILARAIERIVSERADAAIPMLLLIAYLEDGRDLATLAARMSLGPRTASGDKRLEAVRSVAHMLLDARQLVLDTQPSLARWLDVELTADGGVVTDDAYAPFDVRDPGRVVWQAAVDAVSGQRTSDLTGD